MNYPLFFLSLFCFFLINQGEIFAQNASSYFFDTDAPVELMVTANLDELFDNMDEDRRWFLGYVTFTGSKNQLIEMPIRLRTRGFFRRSKQTCSFPPISFDFPEKFEPINQFYGIKKLKFVSHCRDSKQFEQNTLLEYLIYRMYSILSEESFKVRLAKIRWINTGSSKKEIVKWGFFIENQYQMAQRLGGKIIKIQNVHQEKTDFSKITRLAMFEYMVGNTDWGVSTLHNIKLLMLNQQHTPIAIPFDFDWSGFIDASYAKPLPEFGIQSVTERVYRGYYRDFSDLKVIIDEFNEKKSEIMALITQCEQLDPKVKSKSLAYIESFYSIINNEKLAKREFIENCRKNF